MRFVEGLAARLRGEEADLDALGEGRLCFSAFSIVIELLRHNGQGHVPFAVGAAGGGGTVDFEVIERNALEEVCNQRLVLLGLRLGAERGDELEGAG